MTSPKWSDTQARRLEELGLNPDDVPASSDTGASLNAQFQKVERQQVRALRTALNSLLEQRHKTKLQHLRERIEHVLFSEGFTGVVTPTIISGKALEKMTINQDHPLSKQVFWLNEKQCLRPMLAPNLYSLMQDFARCASRPVRFFEIGACFRKESSGARHSNEFTMLNLVEMGLDPAEREHRLKYLAQRIMDAAQIDDYDFESEASAVYGSTLDVTAGPDRVEVASGAMGPHPLDTAWGITDTWVGMGFGLERLLMVANQDTSISRWAKSVSFLDGICLSI